MKDLNDHNDAEIIFGLVSPVGTDNDKVIKALEKKLDDFDYEHVSIKLSDHLKNLKGLCNEYEDQTEYKRIDSLMNRGNELREKLQSGNILSAIAIMDILEYRDKKNIDEQIEENKKYQPLKRHAYIISSLKHPDEVDLLRKTYGKSFWLISVYSPKDSRKIYLSQKIERSSYGSETANSQAESLITRDQDESLSFGQSVRKTFPLGDVFINDSVDTLEKSMERFVNLVFGYPYHTPKIDEYGMYLAQASALMSSSLARQVGAAIMNDTGGVIATGSNEVPFAHGGVCSEDYGMMNREFTNTFDTNTQHKEKILGNLFRLMKQVDWITNKEKDVKELVDMALSDPILKRAKILDITEFGREVHAEMTALMEASRKTVAVKDCTLYCTTFPCHVCAKHIITAGIKQVVFIEPYPKSEAEELFRDSISVDKESTGTEKIGFNPFVGIAPRRYMDVFKWDDRKQKNGAKIDWDNSTKNPRLGDNPMAIKANEEIQAVIFAGKIGKLTSGSNSTYQEC